MGYGVSKDPTAWVDALTLKCYTNLMSFDFLMGIHPQGSQLLQTEILPPTPMLQAKKAA